MKSVRRKFKNRSRSFSRTKRSVTGSGACPRQQTSVLSYLLALIGGNNEQRIARFTGSIVRIVVAQLIHRGTHNNDSNIQILITTSAPMWVNFLVLTTAVCLFLCCPDECAGEDSDPPTHFFCHSAINTSNMWNEGNGWWTVQVLQGF
jgi:hypothetical protein